MDERRALAARGEAVGSTGRRAACHDALRAFQPGGIGLSNFSSVKSVGFQSPSPKRSSACLPDNPAKRAISALDIPK